MERDREHTREQVEDLAQLITRVMGEKGLSQSEIARRVGVHVSTVNTWVRRKRGSKRGPSRETLAKLAEVLGEPEERVFAAAKRKVPGPLTPDAEQRILEYFRGLTEEQQRITEAQMRALYESNQSAFS